MAARESAVEKMWDVGIVEPANSLIGYNIFFGQNEESDGAEAFWQAQGNTTETHSEIVSDCFGVCSHLACWNASFVIVWTGVPMLRTPKLTPNMNFWMMRLLKLRWGGKWQLLERAPRAKILECHLHLLPWSCVLMVCRVLQLQASPSAPIYCLYLLSCINTPHPVPVLVH